jgi:hypothetical protein
MGRQPKEQTVRHPLDNLFDLPRLAHCIHSSRMEIFARACRRGRAFPISNFGSS